MPLPLIDTDRFSGVMRDRSVDRANGRVLVTNFHGTEQEKDFTLPANCGGFGRVRHFRRETSPGWPPNPLPIDPAARALGVPPSNLLTAQVFQNAACNWRCWYCFVPFELLSANKKHAEFLTVGQLVDLYLAEANRPAVIDLTGGQPDLVPEWVPWMMEELDARGLSDSVYLWSDDNLSGDYFWRHLSDAGRDRVAGFKNYGRVCCFKGFDPESFQFNTTAEGALFDRQFELIARLIGHGLDVYGYATFTTPTADGIPEKMARFVDRLQSVSDNLPLRVVPLEIKPFTPVRPRMEDVHYAAVENQHLAIAAWCEELRRRFPEPMRAASICDVPLR
jgi:uncharacterized Fe-S cluster-containing radical SAM superfamily protein